MAPLFSSLRADAPLYVPQASLLTKQTAPAFVSYYVPPPPPSDILAQVGLPCPFTGPPPPPGFVSCPAPPGGFPCPVKGPFAGPPPPPGFANPSPFSRWFPQEPSVDLFPPHEMVARSAPPARVDAAMKDGEKEAAALTGTWRAASGRRRRPKRLPLRQQRAAKLEPVIGTVDGWDAGHVAAKGAHSPRSVLDCPSPPALPPAFPYPPPAPSPPPCRYVQRLQPKQASGRKVRLPQRPRRLFHPSSGLTTLMIRNIPNGFTRQKVMNIIDQHCAEENEKIALAGGGGVKSEYDFLYVPFDFW